MRLPKFSPGDIVEFATGRSRAGSVVGRVHGCARDLDHPNSWLYFLDGMDDPHQEQRATRIFERAVERVPPLPKPKFEIGTALKCFDPSGYFEGVQHVSGFDYCFERGKWFMHYDFRECPKDESINEKELYPA